MLIRDNYNSFTFAPSSTHLNYAVSTAPVNGVLTNVISINGATTEGTGKWSLALPSTSRGGFRLLLLNVNDPQVSGALQYDGFYDIDSVNDLHSLIGGLIDGDLGGRDADTLVFLASLGDISHNDEDTGSCHQSGQTDGFTCAWNDLANSVVQIGGDPLTFKLTGDIHPGFNPDHKDDYLLIGRSIPPLSMPDTNPPVGPQMPPLNAQETGYAIRRHTVSTATSPTSVEGVLVRDHEGYYFPRVQGPLQNLVPPQVTAVASASLQPPVSWPYSSTQGQQNAYTYISQQLCCSDIRSSYVNLNVSPDNWLSQIDQMTYTSGQSSSFSEADFNDVKIQLATEFQYVSVVRNLENNVLALYQSQQSNVALILQQAQDDVLADIYGSNNPPPAQVTPWSVFTSDVFPILEDLSGVAGPFAGTAFRTALGVGTLVINTAVDRTNDAAGNSQLSIGLEHQELAGAQLAGYVVSQYTDSLVTLGNDFNRILSDWGRLRTVGGPSSPASCSGTAPREDTSCAASTWRPAGSSIPRCSLRILSSSWCRTNMPTITTMAATVTTATATTRVARSAYFTTRRTTAASTRASTTPIRRGFRE